MTDNVSHLLMSEVRKGARLLFCLLLLELALLFFQHTISSAISKESITLGRIYESLAARRDECASRSNLLKIYETEEIKMKQKLPVCIDSAERALAKTCERLDALKIAGEVKEKARGNQSVILEVVCEGTGADLAVLLDSLRDEDYAVRLGGLAINALDSERLCFTAEIEYALHPVLHENGDEDA